MTAISKDAAFWTRISRKYAANPIRDMNGYLNTLGRTKSYLKSTDTALEVGCGTGSTALELAPHVAHITATDIAPGMIEIAQERLADAGLSNVTFKVAEVLEHPANTTEYDVVLAHNLLHLVPDLDQALTRLADLTKQGGYFISKTVCAPDRKGLKYALISRVAIPLMQAFGKAPFVEFIAASTLERKIRNAGFEVIETSDQAGTLSSHYVVARKI